MENVLKCCLEQLVSICFVSCFVTRSSYPPSPLPQMACGKKKKNGHMPQSHIVFARAATVTNTRGTNKLFPLSATCATYENLEL